MTGPVDRLICMISSEEGGGQFHLQIMCFFVFMQIGRYVSNTKKTLLFGKFSNLLQVSERIVN